MATMIAEVYEALKEAGVSESKAIKAAEAIQQLRIWLQITSLFCLIRIFPFVLSLSKDARKNPASTAPNCPCFDKLSTNGLAFREVIFSGILSKENHLHFVQEQILKYQLYAEGEFKLLKWMIGCNLAFTMAMLWKILG